MEVTEVLGRPYVTYIRGLLKACFAWSKCQDRLTPSPCEFGVRRPFKCRVVEREMTGSKV